VTGEDTPDNFAILFGPNWENGIADLHKRTRIEVLLSPPPGSPAHMVGGFMDEGCPVWRPRGPCAEEEAQLRRVADLQRVMRQAMAEEE
jgi:hypothetical protein